MLTMLWPHESGLDTLRFIAVLVAQVGLPSKILLHLRKRERAGLQPGESETMLL
jgi:hypothetical protein